MVSKIPFRPPIDEGSQQVLSGWVYNLSGSRCKVRHSCAVTVGPSKSRSQRNESEGCSILRREPLIGPGGRFRVCTTSVMIML
jgi:hypothetical protein